MTVNAPPSGNPADKYSLQGVIRKVLDKFLQKRIDDMLPAVVIAYNASTNMACVQPLITVVTTDGQQVPRAQYAAIPVYQISAGGFIMRFPINAGDFGWIKANDRDISIFMQSGTQSPPNTQRKHSFKDAIFLPQTVWSNAAIAGGDTANLVIQNYAGTVKISLSETAINVEAPTEINLTAPTVNINASIAINLTTPITTMSGIFTATNEGSETTAGTINGSLVTTGDVTANGISLDNHVHGGVMTGGSNTEGPTG